MAGKIICLAISLGCMILFYSIGVYAAKSTKPMGFWAGEEVEPSLLTDVSAYNRENGSMWKKYSLWYALAAIAGIWSLIAFLAVLVLSASAGLALLILQYRRIFEKYRVR